MAILFTFISGFYLSIMSWIYAKGKVNKWSFCILVGFLSSVFSSYFSHDAVAYQTLFLNYSTTPFSEVLDEMMAIEPFFLLSSKVFYFLPPFIYFFLYAVTSFAVKLALIEKVSRDPVLSLLCFFSFFFLYLDGTVVRVSLGIAVCYWGVYLLSKKNIIGFVFVVLLSSFFLHYSLIVLLIMPFFRNHVSIRIIWFLMLVFFLLYISGFGLLSSLISLSNHLDETYFGVNKLVNYLKYSDVSHPYSIFFVSLFVLSLFTYFCCKNDLNEFELIAFNMLFLSFLILIVFYQSQAIQNRVSEIFRYSIIFIAPFFYQVALVLLKKTNLAMMAYCSFLVSYFIYYYYYKEIISDKNLTLIYSFLEWAR